MSEGRSSAGYVVKEKREKRAYGRISVGWWEGMRLEMWKEGWDGRKNYVRVARK